MSLSTDPAAGNQPVTDRPSQGPKVEEALDDLWHHVRFPAATTSSDAESRGLRTSTLPVQSLSRQFGERAMDCVSASIQGDRTALVHHSADLFGFLFAIWGEVGLDPREVWTELHKREQLGTLLMQLNQAQNQLPRRVLKPWRVDSTKLP